MVWGLGGLGFGAWGLRFTELPFAGVFLKSSCKSVPSLCWGLAFIARGKGFCTVLKDWCYC